MMDLITALTLPDSIPYDGSLLVRAEYTRFRAGTSARWENEILKQSRRTCVIRCTGYRQEEAVHSLTASLLLRPVGTAESPAAFSVPENALSAGICWRSFSKEEIKSALEAMELSPTIRGEKLSLAQFAALADELKKIQQGGNIDE